ncbi:unnamed protein product [Diatraea saccharalis]|uniref:Uncharacterized protein n=1 Tax=Diatraea saccharalis TaxID=40085 RepID=A0A9N9WHE5_9NEOP|nr:unnamed protein product [Diatraea saccharalis]
MLSDEMLSIKYHFYEQDKKTSTVAMTSKGKLATPTLEVKQKWPFGDFNTKLNDDDESYQTDGMNNVTSRDSKQYKTNKNQNKILELRSLPEATPHFPHPIYLHHETKRCTCVKHLFTGMTSTPGTCRSRSICTKSSLDQCSRCSSTLCTQNINLCGGTELVTQSDVHLCTQSGSCSESNSQLCTHKECTRGETFYSTAFYVTYQPFFIGITQPSNVLYYHPDVVNQMKLPKRKKHRKTTTRNNNDDDLYYDDEIEILKGQIDENDKDSYEDFIDDNKSRDQSRHTGIILDTSKKGENIGTPEINKDRKDKKLMIKEKTIYDILHDLKTYYSDSVIKDCYCSLMSSSSFGYSLGLSNFVLGLFILLLSCCLN